MRPQDSVYSLQVKDWENPQVVNINRRLGHTRITPIATADRPTKYTCLLTFSEPGNHILKRLRSRNGFRQLEFRVGRLLNTKHLPVKNVFIQIRKIKKKLVLIW